jgi:hypothetical protein
MTTRLRVHQIKTSMRTWMNSHLVIKFAQCVVVGQRKKKLEAEAEERAVNTAVNLSTTSPVLKTLFFQQKLIMHFHILESSHILQEPVAMRFGRHLLLA